MTGALRPDSLMRNDAVSQFDPATIADAQSARTAGVLGVALTIAVVTVILATADRPSLAAIVAILPHQVPFFLVVIAFALLTPLSEWFIYRRLWSIPPSGILALGRKFAANEVLLGYIGDAQFYAWARQHIGDRSAPFGAIKDVAILSAIMGNVVTLGLLAATAVLPGKHVIGFSPHALSVALVVILASSTVMLILRNHMFTLPRGDLLFIACAQFCRVIASLGLMIMMWHLALPELPLATWVLLAALRMLISRFPLIANKDLLLAALALLTLGHVPQLVPMLLMMAGLLLLIHLLIGFAGAKGLMLSAKGYTQ